MKHREILELRLKIETDPILTDEEIEFIWNAIDKQTAERPIKGSINPDKTQQYKCPTCGRLWWEWNFIPEYCGSCGQRIDLINEEIISQQDFTKAMDGIMAHIGIDMSTKSDFTPSDIVPNAFVGFLGKTEDGKVELAKKEIVKIFNINKSMEGGKK